MNTFVVYLLMLKPALLTALLVLGLALLLGVWISPHINALMNRRHI